LDYRCPTWSILKYLKRFRARAMTPNKTTEFAPKNILLNITDSGHGGEVGTSQGIKEKALYYAFLDYVLLNASNEITLSRKLYA
jgi:protease II